MFAAIRPDDWNFPLLLHVLGASVLLGALIAVVTMQLIAFRRSDDALPLARLSFRTLLFGAIPAWFLMRLAGEWVASKGWNDVEPAPDWLGIGYITAEGGGLLILIATILSGLGLRRLRASGGNSTTMIRVSSVLIAICVLAYVIAVWAMSAKPG